MLSLILDQSIDYPDGEDFFSPDERFPEYQFDQISSRKNPVYRAVRDCFLQANLDHEHIGSPAWNPLGEYIPPGSRVFVLCNFAHERRPEENAKDFLSRCTHGSVIRAVIDYILIAVGQNGTVRFGNAPTQFGRWEQVLANTGANKTLEFYQKNHCPVEVRDLRFFVMDATHIGAVRSVERRGESCAARIDLDGRSMFNEFDEKGDQQYRVMNYAPDRTIKSHSSGKHEYIINREILESDIIFSIPKLKTHEKVGISCALKGFVGIVGHKDSLPHHRYGTPKMGGDEYPVDRLGLLRLTSAVHERVQKIPPETSMGSLARVAYRILKRVIRIPSPIIEGAWWGNDTAWRMVLDLVRIATYASETGEMQNQPCRKHLAMIDGIYGGEGEGPAYPTAVRSGVLLFGSDLPMVDTLSALLMGFTPEKIPLVREAFCLTQYPITNLNPMEERVIFNSQIVSVQHFRENPPYRFKPNEGWKGRI